MILYYIFISLLLNGVYSYNCSENKILDTQLRTCIDIDSYTNDDNHTNKYLNIGYDPLLKEFTEEDYYYKINDTIKTCPRHYIFNGITCKLDQKVIASKPNNVICNIKYISSIDYKNLPVDICNYLIFGPFDMNDQYEITYVNFWENTTKLDSVLKHSKKYVNTESVLGLYVSLGRNPEFWKNILENKDINIIKEKLEDFVKEYTLDGVALRYINTTKFTELVDKLSIPFMININTIELSNADNLKNIINKAKYVNVLNNKEKNTDNKIIPLFEQKDLEKTIDDLISLNVNKNKINLGYPLYGKKYEISDENAKLLYKNRNVTEIKSEKNLKMFSDDNVVPINSICNSDVKICTKEDLENKDLPNCIYSIADNFGNWLVYKDKLTNFIDSNTFYKINEIRHSHGILGVYIDSLDDDLGIKCNKDYPVYYFSNTLTRVTHLKPFSNIILKINTSPKSYFIKKDKNTSESTCLNDPCTHTGFMEYKCNEQKYIKCVKMKNIFYKYIFSCRKGFKFNKSTKKCRKIKS